MYILKSSYIRCPIAIFACLIAAACSQGDEPSYTHAERQTTVAKLSILSADSLLFSDATPANTSSPRSVPTMVDDIPVLAYSLVEPSFSFGRIAEAERDAIFNISLDTDLTITVRINRNQSVGDQFRSLSGTILPPHRGSITLSVDQQSNRLTGMFDLTSENRLFFLRHNLTHEDHYLMEVDRTQLDIMEGSEPLETN